MSGTRFKKDPGSDQCFRKVSQSITIAGLFFHDTANRHQIEDVGFTSGSVEREFFQDAADDVFHVVLDE